MYSKLKKGYKIIKDHGKGSSKILETTQYPSKSIAKRVEAQKKNRYLHLNDLSTSKLLSPIGGILRQLKSRSV